MMRKRDRLKGFFYKGPSRQESSQPQTPNEPAALASTSTTSGQQPLISCTLTTAGSTVPSVVVPTPVTAAAAPLRNEAFARALQKHIDGLPEDEKAAFQHASRGINEKNVLQELRDLDDDHMQNSSLRKHSKSLTKFLGLLDRFLGGAAIAIQHSPEISSLVVGGLRLLVDLAKDFTSLFDRLSKMMVEFGDFLDVLAEYAMSTRDDSLVCTTLAAVYGDILKFYQEARRVFVNLDQERERYVSFTVFFRSQWEPFEEKFGDIKLSMQHHLQVLGHAAAAATITMVEKLSLDEKKRRQRELVKDREDFLNWISTASHDEKHTAVYEKRHPGTGDWFLQTWEFDKWLSSTTSSLLWCHGKPGAGKSILASHVVERLFEVWGPDEKVGICFAYYDYIQATSQGFAQIVLSLIKQLCRKADSIPDGFKKAKQNADSPSTLANLNNFNMITDNFEDVFLIIDALDECLDDERPRMLRFLAEALGTVSNIRILVTSRREEDIVNKFEALGMPTIQLEAASVAADIEQYVFDEVWRLRLEKELHIADEKLAENIIETLTSRSEGMFLWVNLQLHQLCKASKRRKDHYVEQALQKLPTGLDGTYRRVAQQIENYDDGMKELAVACFMWVFYAERPLTIDELRHAVAVADRHADLQKFWPEPEEKESILSACSNMLEMDSWRVVRPIHYSVKEFFTRPGDVSQGGFPQLSQRCYSQQTLATTCIDRLIHMPQFGPFQDRKELRRCLRDAPFLWYAARHFDIHTRKAGDLSKDSLQKLRSFMNLGESYHTALFQMRALRPSRDSQQQPFTGANCSVPSAMSKVSTIFCSQLFYVPELKEFWEQGQIPRGTIHQAASFGLLEAVEHLLDQGIHVDERDALGATALHHAAKEGSKAVVELLIQRGGDVNIQDESYGTALEAAAFERHEKVVQTLLDAGANVNAQDGAPWGNPLQAAAAGGSQNVVKLLLDAGANVNARGGKYFDSPLEAAAESDYEMIVRMLLDEGADVYEDLVRRSGFLQPAICRILQDAATKNARR